MRIFKSSVTATHLVLVSLFGLLSFACEATPVYSTHTCTNGSYYRPNTPFQSNLNVLLASLVSNATLHNGFYRTSMPLETPNDLKGLFLCRGDVTPSACEQCVAAAANNITRRCTNETESIIWYDKCMLHYSNDSYLNNIVLRMDLKNEESVPVLDSARFSEFLAATLKGVAQEVVSSPSGEKFPTLEVDLTSSMKLYSPTQCTPDLSLSECNTCFQSAINCEMQEMQRYYELNEDVLPCLCTIQFFWFSPFFFSVLVTLFFSRWIHAERGENRVASHN